MKLLMVVFSVAWFAFSGIGTQMWAGEQFPWPVQPFDQSHEITGNFCEFRDTGSSDHFHNGTDIPKPDGSPVYPVKDGQVTAMGSDWVRIEDKAYVHIVPASGLSIGDRVYASQTVIGTIEPGLGHVHFTNGYVGSERNSMLPNSGLTPLVDTWKPIIRFVKFFENGSSTEYPASGIAGKVDIVVKVDEQNGPPSSPISRRNNGTYKIGYKILSADTSTVVYLPPSNGWRFQFDTKPSNSYVHIVFRKEYSSTTSHTYQVTNDVSRDNYWDTGQLDPGNYVVMVFTEDTRGNADTAYVPVTVKELDRTPPEQPTWKWLSGTADSLKLFWYANQDSDLLGYRLYFTFDNNRWSEYATESDVTAADSAFYIATRLNRDIYFRISAVDNSPLNNESAYSSVYGMTNGPNISTKILIVDGFDRRDGAWQQPAHSFVYDYGHAVWGNQMGFDSAPNEAVRDGSVQLEDYPAVFWFTGDDNGVVPALDSIEQAKLKHYLEQGGQLFINGAYLAYSLDPEGYSNASSNDQAFLQQFLKADYQQANTTEHAVIGQPGSWFEGLNIEFSISHYAVDSTDVIEPVGNNSRVAFIYPNGQPAGVFYEGTFGSGTQTGRLVYLTFPFETISSDSVKQALVERVFQFFFPALGLEDQPSAGVEQFQLLPAYPNPFNPSTTITYTLPRKAIVEIAIFNVLGQQVRRLVSQTQTAGIKQVQWDGRDDDGNTVPSGIYIIRFNVEDLSSHTPILVQSRKVVFLK